MKKLIIIALILLSSWASAKENQAPNMQQMLVTAKYAGFCGSIKQMAAFQQATRMKGGDEFLMRFLNTEVARLGMKDIDQMFAQCTESVSTYKIFMQIAESIN